MKTLKKMAVPALFLTAVAGCWISFHYAFKTCRFDSDLSDLVMLWRGWRRHGFGFFPSWYFTQDNWLLSLAPFSFLAYGLLGATPGVVTGIGWAIFVINAMLAAIVARLIVGRWSAVALLILCLGLFAGEYAMKNALLAYPITHNSSMAWAFLALIVAAYGINHQGLFSTFAIAGIIFLAGVSDPWFSAICTLPLALALWRTGRTGLEYRLQSVRLLRGVLAGWALAETKALGLLYFLPGPSFHLTFSPHKIIGNLKSYSQSLAMIFQISRVWQWSRLSGAVFLLFGVFLLLGALKWMIGDKPKLSIIQQMALHFMLASCVLISCLFIFSTLPDEAVPLAGSRLLINIFYEGPLLIAFIYACRWQSLSLWVRTAAIIWVSIFILAGAASYTGAWAKQGTEASGFRARELADFLDENGLHYGFGQYFAAKANAITWISGNKVVIRPVKCGHEIFQPDGTISSGPAYFAPRRSQSSRFWYEDVNAGRTGPEFLILKKNNPACADGPAGAVSQFGKPDKALDFQKYIVLVWSHPILPEIKAKDPAEQWEKMNQARNLAAISKACSFIGVSYRPAQSVYFWLVKHNLAR